MSLNSETVLKERELCAIVFFSIYNRNFTNEGVLKLNHITIPLML